MKKRLPVYIVVLLTLLTALFPFSGVQASSPQIMPPPIMPRPIGFPEIRYQRVEVTVEGQVAMTRVQMLFVNRSQMVQEGTYVFPLPADAAISSLTMWADGQKMAGEILDKDKARQIYESIVRQRRDPALLQYVGSKAVELRVFPIPPGGERKIELEYSLVLKRDAGLIRYVYPLAGTSFPGQVLRELTITLRINASEPLRNIYSPSHDVSIVRRGERSADIGYEASNVSPSKDLEVFYSVDDKEVGLNLLTYKTGSRGYFLLLVSPRPELPRTEVVARDVVLVVDVSGSMGGVKIQQAKEALKFILGHLNPEDRFNIVSFSSGVDMFSPSLRPISEKDKGLEYVNGLRAAGSTNIYDALAAAIGLVSRERPAVVIFLTDGQPTVGITDQRQIVAALEKAPADSLRLFTFGIGDDVNASLLDLLAEKGHGVSQYVRRDDQVLPVVTTFYEKISTPVVVDLSLDFGSIRVEDVYPRPLPDLYLGSQLTIVGRYRDSGQATLSIEGKSYGKTLRVNYPAIRFPDRAEESAFIPRLWATRKIGYLLDQVRLQGPNQEVIDEVRSLSTEFGIMTPYTSYFIQENVPMPLPPRPMPGFPAPTPAPMPEFRGAPQSGAAGGGAFDRVGPAGPAGPQGKAGQQGTALAPAAPPASAIDQSQQAQQFKQSERADTGVAPQARAVGEKTFFYKDGRWVDSKFKDGMPSVQIAFGGQEYFDLLAKRPEWGRYFSIAEKVTVVLDGKAYVVTEGTPETLEAPSQTPGPRISPQVPTQTNPVVSPGPDNTTEEKEAYVQNPPSEKATNPFRRFWVWLTGLFRG